MKHPNGSETSGAVSTTQGNAVPQLVPEKREGILEPAILILADGAEFEGEAFGARSTAATGELVFNTSLSGYQEIITDPSYAGQVVAFTYPHIGNYGTNSADDESARPFLSGIITRDVALRPSNWRSEESLNDFLIRHGVPGITGIDTRRLTRHLRSAGAVPGAFGTDESEVRALASSATGTDGIDLAATVTTKASYIYGDDDAPFTVVAYDFGIKRTILRHLAGSGCRVEVVPASTPASEVIARNPDGIFLSNGPGDPAAVVGAAANALALVESGIPLFGICLGHQILGLALGAQTYKLPFGHHGGNHPVRNEVTGRVEITSQNHNYAVDPGEMERSVKITHVNLNDGVVEGLRLTDAPVFSVQHHPEAGPGPHESSYLFEEFTTLMTEVR
ncbi:MAG: glutamine-hydrolyzing carbamoyl-phosphate synthase small subunit [Acidimicrobiia bacterium]|nr:glutamine-hydrolyzing carbamoyl-phosphate synthase small subunit [Acidimicrobiia bacterium]